MRVSYAIVFASDMKRSVAFYRDIIGLPLKYETPHWTEFATQGATLALHASSGPRRESRDAQDLPPGCCRPGISVPDLDAFHARMLAAGVPCVQEPTTTFGVRIAQYTDPDGLGISVSQDRS